MSSDQPPPGPGRDGDGNAEGNGDGNGDEDPFRKRPPGEGRPPQPPGVPPSEHPPPYGGGHPHPGVPPPTPGTPPPESPYPGSPYPGPPYSGAPYPGSPYPGPPPYPGSPYSGEPGGGQGLSEPEMRGMPPLAGSGRRLGARILDALIVGIPVGLVLWIFGLVHWDEGGGAGDAVFTGDFGGSVITVVVYLVYEAVMYARTGQTLGKMALGIRVAMLEDGSVPTPRAAWTRAAVYSVPNVVPCCGSLFWLVNVLWHLRDRPYRQCLHDKAAATVVVSAR